MAVKAIPEGYSTLTPYLNVDDAPGVIDFAVKGFGGKLISDVKGPDGKTMHASVKIGNSVVMVCQASAEHKASASMIYVYVPDVDAAYKQALKGGGTKMMEPKDQLYGDRSGGLTDCCGNQWWIGTHIEDVSDKDIEKRYAESKEGAKAKSATS